MLQFSRAPLWRHTVAALRASRSPLGLTVTATSSRGGWEALSGERRLTRRADIGAVSRPQHTFPTSSHHCASVAQQPLAQLASTGSIRRMSASGDPSVAPREPRPGRVHVNGVDIHYVESGGAHAGLPTLVALPGALGTAESDFGPQLRGLADSVHVVSFDPRGCVHCAHMVSLSSLIFFVN